MFLPVLAALAASLLFYLLLPLAGAFRIRSSWRRFRSRLIELRHLPRLRYRHIAAGLLKREEGAEEHRASGETGAYRLYGRVEALEGENRLWLRGADVSALVDLSASPLYVLESPEAETPPWSPERAGRLERLAWTRVRVFSEGTKLFVGGRLSFDEGRPVFVSVPGEELLVISYDGEDEGLFSRLIAAGRRRNEYWNSLSRISLSLGIGGLGLLLVLLASGNYFPSVRFFVLLIALAPVIPLAPPGLGGFLLYRRLWRRALGLRIFRDLIRLPLGFFGSEKGLAEAGKEAMEGKETGAEPREAKLSEGGSYLWRRGVSESGLGAALILDPESLPRKVGEGWTLFEAAASDDPLASLDPAAERVALRGEPIERAREAEREADVATLAAAACLAFALLLNLAIAYALWRYQA